MGSPAWPGKDKSETTVFPKILHLIEFGRETEHLSGEIDPPAAG
jgi:hypothetical protein